MDRGLELFLFCLGTFCFLLWFLVVDYALFCLPVFLLLRTGFGIVWKVRKLHPSRVLSGLDALSLLLAPVFWAFCGSRFGDIRSLSNLAIEPACIGWGWCLCAAVRYGLATKNPARRPGAGAVPTLVAVFLLAALLAVVFPGLPE